jgi:hypothetical protein
MAMHLPISRPFQPTTDLSAKITASTSTVGLASANLPATSLPSAQVMKPSPMPVAIE